MTAPQTARQPGPLSAVRVVLSGRLVNTLLVAGHLYFGAGYLAGGPRVFSSRTFGVAMQWAPGPVWAWSILAGFVLSFLAPWLPRGGFAALHALAALPLAAFALALAITEFGGTSQGWGGALLFCVPVAGHARIVWARYHPTPGVGRG